MTTALLPVFPQDFLRKEFSEENILFWQACECFSHVPAHDKKEVNCSSEQGLGLCEGQVAHGHTVTSSALE